MSKLTKPLILGLSLILVTFTIAGGLGFGVKASTDDGAYRQMGVYSEVLSHIKQDYVEEPNITAVTDGALHGLLESLDANSSYLTAPEYKQYKDLKLAKGEIGAAISKRYGYAAVVAVMPGGPADKAGLKNGDIIEAIQGKSTRIMSLAEIRGILMGAVGSNVDVSVIRPSKADPVKITITRDVVKPTPVTTKLMDASIGYIHVQGFPKGRAEEIAAAVKDLQKQGAKKLILDLRNSGDGDESEGIATANLFLDKGIITYLEGQKYPKEMFNADSAKQITTLPLVVVVDRSSAGPAEIVADAIKDNKRGDVVGDKTFGTGSIQKLIELQDGSALILSVAKYYSPDGKAIQDVAVTPNFVVSNNNNDDFVSPDEDQNVTTPGTEQKNQTDEQLQRAIEVLNSKDQKAA